MDNTEAHWWNTFFDDDYAAFGIAAEPEADATLARSLIGLMGLSNGDAVFDQCCGIGRLSFPFAEAGLRVVGVDITPGYIEHARREAEARNLACEFHCADAHDFAVADPCNGAFNWFTSFGYHDDDARNICMFQRAADSLKTGGTYLVEYQNFARIWRAFQRVFIVRRQREDGELIVLQEHMPNFETGMMQSEWTFIHPDGRRVVHRPENRMYMPHEIVNMLKQCGFGEFQLLGSHEGEVFTRESFRLIVLAKKL